MVKPTYSTATSTLRRDGLLSRQAVRSDLGCRAPQDLLQVAERQAGVDDVLDDDDVAAVERGVEVLDHLDFAGRGRALGVARDRHEIERDVAGDVPREVGQEDERALQHGDDVEIVGEVPADLQRHFGDALLNLCFGQ